MTKDEALKLALNVLINRVDSEHKAITAINDALALPVATSDTSQERVDETAKQRHEAQPEQDPVAWMYQDKSTHEVRFQKHMRDFVDHSRTSEVPLYSEPLANHELQCVCGAVWCGDEMVHVPNKTTPPHRKPLTDEEIDKLPWEPHEGNPMTFAEGLRYFARAIEAAHGIKE